VLPNGDYWVTKYRSKLARARRSTEIIRLIGLRNYYSHNNNVSTANHALAERLFFVKNGDAFATPPAPDRGAFRKLNKFRHTLINRLPLGLRPISIDQFLSYYEGPRLHRYTQAARSLEMLPVRKFDSRVKFFVKAEKVCKVGAVPRGISPRDARYNIVLGVYLKCAESHIFKAINSLYGETVVAKGLNAVERGQLLHDKFRRFADPVVVGLDASRFDQHVSKQALQWEHSVYLSLYPGDRELQRLLSWQVVNIGSFYAPDGTIKFRRTGGRMSGDMNTALGNVLLMCAMMWTYSREVGVPMSLLNDGDDCVVIVERHDYDRFVGGVQEWFHGLGFTMKVEAPVCVLEQICFCQSHPVWDGKGYRMVRDPRKAIPKDLFSVNRLDTRGRWDQLRSAVADCGLALSDGIPVMPSFYHMVGRGAPSRVRPARPETGLDYLSWGLSYTNSKITDEARVSFWRAFSITPAEQELLEQEFALVTPQWAAVSPVGETNEYTTNITSAFTLLLQQQQ